MKKNIYGNIEDIVSTGVTLMNIMAYIMILFIKVNFKD